MYSNGGPRQAPDNWLQPHSHSRARVSDPYVTGLMGWSRSLLVGCVIWDYLGTSSYYIPTTRQVSPAEPLVDPATQTRARRLIRRHE